MALVSAPHYVVDSEARVTTDVPVRQDGVTAYALAERSFWLLRKTDPALTQVNGRLPPQSGSGWWAQIPFGDEATIDLTGLSGTQAVPSAKAMASLLRVQGAPAGDVTLSFAAGALPGISVVNETTDLSKALYAKGPSNAGPGLFFGPGVTRQLNLAGGVAVDEVARRIVYATSVSLVRGSAGSTDVTIGRLPDEVRLTRVTPATKVFPVGGTVALQVGVSVGGFEVIAAPGPAQVSVAAAGSAVGDNPNQWGTDLITIGSAYYATSKTLSLRFTTSAAITAGRLLVIVEALALGDL